MAAGESVVADIGHAIGCEQGFGDGEQFLANGGRYPGIDAVGDDVVELAERAGGAW